MTLSIPLGGEEWSYELRDSFKVRQMEYSSSYGFR